MQRNEALEVIRKWADLLRNEEVQEAVEVLLQEEELFILTLN